MPSSSSDPATLCALPSCNPSTVQPCGQQTSRAALALDVILLDCLSASPTSHAWGMAFLSGASSRLTQHCQIPSSPRVPMRTHVVGSLRCHPSKPPQAVVGLGAVHLETTKCSPQRDKTTAAVSTFLDQVSPQRSRLEAWPLTARARMPQPRRRLGWTRAVWLLRRRNPISRLCYGMCGGSPAARPGINLPRQLAMPSYDLRRPSTALTLHAWFNTPGEALPRWSSWNAPFIAPYSLQALLRPGLSPASSSSPPTAALRALPAASSLGLISVGCALAYLPHLSCTRCSRGGRPCRHQVPCTMPRARCRRRRPPRPACRAADSARPRRSPTDRTPGRGRGQNLMRC